jgi:hypothetical protein
VSLFDSGAAGGDGRPDAVLARESTQFYADSSPVIRGGSALSRCFPSRMSTPRWPSWPMRWASWDLTGVMLLSNYAGRYLGDPSFDPACSPSFVQVSG